MIGSADISNSESAEMSSGTPSSQPSGLISGDAAQGLVAGTILLAAILWTYWSAVLSLIGDWKSDDDYSSGYLVPFAALYVVWCQRKELRNLVLRPCWWGIVVILAAHVIHIVGLHWLYESIERYALLLSVAGVVLLVGGWQVFWRLKWVLAFLLLMVPLPGRIHNMISGPLQSWAAVGAVVTLEVLGISVTQEGNVMVLNDKVPVAVAEACSGLRMLTAFIMVACVMAFLANRPMWQKATLAISSIPVAIICNLVRLVVTALLFLVVSNAFAERFFHDFAGWTMMPMAVFILLGEMWIMSRLVIKEPHVRRKSRM